MIKSNYKKKIIFLMVITFILFALVILHSSKVQAVEYSIKQSSKIINVGETVSLVMFKDGKRIEPFKMSEDSQKVDVSESVEWKISSNVVEEYMRARDTSFIAVRGKKAGTVKISALIKNREVASVNITVKTTEYSISPSRKTINVGEKADFKILKNGKDFDTLKEGVEWKIIPINPMTIDAVEMTAYARNYSSITVKGNIECSAKIAAFIKNRLVASADITVKKNTFTGWNGMIYYKNGKEKYQKDSNGIVTEYGTKNKVTGWIDTSRYINGVLDLITQKDGTIVYAKTGKKANKWVGNRYIKDGKFYAEMYNASTKKISAAGKAYRIGYKKSDGTIDESKLIKNKIVGSRYFNEKGEMAFKVSNKKAYKTEKGKITNELFSGIAEESVYKDGILVARRNPKDKLLHKVKSDGSGKMTSALYTGWIGKSYYMDGEEMARISNLITYVVGKDRPQTFTENFVKVEKTDKVTAWVGHFNYSYDSKKGETKLRYISYAGKVYKAKSNKEPDLNKPVTCWIFNEYYKEGNLFVGLFKDDKKTLSSSGKAYTVKNDGTADKLFTGKLGSKYFEKGVLVAVEKDK